MYLKSQFLFFCLFKWQYVCGIANLRFLKPVFFLQGFPHILSNPNEVIALAKDKLLLTIMLILDFPG